MESIDQQGNNHQNCWKQKQNKQNKAQNFAMWKFTFTSTNLKILPTAAIAVQSTVKASMQSRTDSFTLIECQTTTYNLQLSTLICASAYIIELIHRESLESIKETKNHAFDTTESNS